MPDMDIRTLVQNISQGFFPHYQSAIQPVLEEAGMQGGDWFRLFVAHGLEPDPLAAERMHAMFPYGAIENQKQGLAETASKGLLEAVNEDTYRMTDRGRKGITRFYEVTAKALAKREVLPAADMNRLADLLQRVIEATEAAPEPAEKPGFRLSRRTDPGPDTASSVRIDQYITDLLRYRDDAHIAAWAPHQISGHTWEAFTFVWRGDADGAASLAEQLQQRGHSEKDYAEALRDLVQRGWLKEADGKYQTTESGKQLREEADTATDSYFYVGWSALSEKESGELKRLLQKLSDRLQDIIVEDRADLNPLVAKVSQAIYALAHPVVEPILREADIAERGLPFTLMFAQASEPQPISAATIQEQIPYSTADSWLGHMKQLSDKGLLTANGTDMYHLTDGGSDVWSRVRKAFDERLREVEDSLTEAFPAEELDRLAGLLGRLVDGCLAAPEPPGTRSIERSHRLAPGADAPALSKIDQCIDDLNAFRDDAHIAAFKGHNVSGHTWEIFTFLWRDEVKNAAEMQEKAPFRGHSVESYSDALDTLVKHGWIEIATDGSYNLTQSGQQVREEAEAVTNRYYFAPWTALISEETQELRTMLERLETSLQQIGQAEATPA